MIILQSIAFILILAYIAYIYLKNKNERDARLLAYKELAPARKKLAEASDDFTHVESQIFQLIEEQFEEPYSKFIKEGVVNVGMPATFLTMAWGHPQRIERTDKKWGHEKWFYKDQETSGGSTLVVIENDKVVKLKDF